MSSKRISLSARKGKCWGHKSRVPVRDGARRHGVRARFVTLWWRGGAVRVDLFLEEKIVSSEYIPFFSSSYQNVPFNFVGFFIVSIQTTPQNFTNEPLILLIPLILWKNPIIFNPVWGEEGLVVIHGNNNNWFLKYKTLVVLWPIDHRVLFKFKF